MRKVLCGPVTLHLAGFLTLSDSLIHSILHQLQLQSSSFPYTPLAYISWLKDILNRYRLDNLSDPLSRLRAISECLSITIIAYHGNDRTQITPNYRLREHMTPLRIYFILDHFDSVIRESECLLINDPLPLLKGTLFIRFATWNLRGSTNDEDRAMVDFCLQMNKLDLVAVQETHMIASNLSSASYSWILGPQFQDRLSRGIGFLVSHNLKLHVKSVKFITANIGYITLHLPYLVKDLHIINVHKLSNSDRSSIIETG